jgi:hypothetical protein
MDACPHTNLLVTLRNPKEALGNTALAGADHSTMFGSNTCSCLKARISQTCCLILA